jgi:glc operon protein GlcG
MYQSWNLSHGEAQVLIEAVRAQAEAAGKAVCVAVADEHGELLAFLRMDRAPLPSIDIAANKAYTAARERAESGRIGARMRETAAPMTNYGSLRFTGWGGGLPILREGTVIGAIAVSGLTEEEDVELARAALKAAGR